MSETIKSGFLIVDKPQDFTSFDVCAKLRGMLRTRKIGHAGTLDPMASGVLPVLVGSATRALELLPEHGKEYEAGFRLGLVTDTLDMWGSIISDSRVSIERERVEEKLSIFRGDIEQLPPMYSAVQIGGKRLYDLARKGVEVERPKRRVSISLLELTEYQPETGCGVLRVKCSKGTYIRSLVADIGSSLGCGAAVTSLRRLSACGFSLEQARGLEEIQRYCDEDRRDELILGVSSAFTNLKKVYVTAAQAVRWRNGGALSLDRLGQAGKELKDGEQACVFQRLDASDEDFLGIGEASREKNELRILKRF